MKKNISFIIISIVIAAILFATAATCNMCGTPIDIGIGEEESTKDEMISEPQRETTGTAQGQSQNTEAPQEGNNPPIIREIELFGGIDVELYAEVFDMVASAELEEIEIPFTIEAYDEDGDELSYSAYDSLGTSFDVSKTDNNNAQFIWRNPVFTGPYTLTVEVSDGRGGVDTYLIDMNLTAELPTNNPPEITDGIIIIGPTSGEPITADYVFTDEEYEIRVEAIDPDGGALYYEWALEGGNGNCGTITNISANPTTWITPAQAGEVIDEWCYIIVRVTDSWGELVIVERRVHVVTGSSI